MCSVDEAPMLQHTKQSDIASAQSRQVIDHPENDEIQGKSECEQDTIHNLFYWYIQRSCLSVLYLVYKSPITSPRIRTVKVYHCTISKYHHSKPSKQKVPYQQSFLPPNAISSTSSSREFHPIWNISPFQLTTFPIQTPTDIAGRNSPTVCIPHIQAIQPKMPTIDLSRTQANTPPRIRITLIINGKQR